MRKRAISVRISSQGCRVGARERRNLFGDRRLHGGVGDGYRPHKQPSGSRPEGGPKACVRDAFLDDLVERLRAGDDDATAEVHRQFVRRLVALAHRQFDSWVRPLADHEGIVTVGLPQLLRAPPPGAVRAGRLGPYLGVAGRHHPAQVPEEGRVPRRRQTGRPATGPGLGTTRGDGSTANLPEVIDPEPTPDEAAMLSETVADGSTASPSKSGRWSSGASKAGPSRRSPSARGARSGRCVGSGCGWRSSCGVWSSPKRDGPEARGLGTRERPRWGRSTEEQSRRWPGNPSRASIGVDLSRSSDGSSGPAWSSRPGRRSRRSCRTTAPGCAALIELVHADLELRLKAGRPVDVPGYLRRFPELDDTAAASLATRAEALRRRLGTPGGPGGDETRGRRLGRFRTGRGPGSGRFRRRLPGA